MRRSRGELPGAAERMRQGTCRLREENPDPLTGAIQKAFRFHNDCHMYEFFMDGRPFSEKCYRRYRENEDASSAGIRLDDLDLKKVRIFFFTFLSQGTGGLRPMYRSQRRKKSAAVLSF
jgi:hypothetical protein